MSIQSEIDRIKAGKADAKAALIERGVDPRDAPIDEYGNQIRAIPTGVTSFNGRGGTVKPQAGDYTSEMVGAIDQTEKGRASGVASLDADGKVPAGQLPEMNYDPAGSAQTVQQELNTHAANKTLHVTAAERQAWNSKAPGTHTHTAAQIGALPISGGTMTGALNMNGKALTNLPAPKNNKDAVPKDYVDAAVVDKPYKLLEKIISSKSWTCPDGVILISALIVGGGGGGGDRGKGSIGGGGGQGGEAILVRDIKVIPGNEYEIIIGAGGERGWSALGDDGSKGGNTTAFGFTARGGEGGKSNGTGGDGEEAGAAGGNGGTTVGYNGYYGINPKHNRYLQAGAETESASYGVFPVCTDLEYKDWYGSGGGGGANYGSGTTAGLGGPNAGNGLGSGTSAGQGKDGFGGGGGGQTANGGSGAVLIYVRGE